MKALFFSATLRGAEAPVWRRFCVPMDYDFAKLHEVLQILFGYSGREGYEFVFDTKEGANDLKLSITADVDLYERYRFLKSDEGKHYLADKEKEGYSVDMSVEVAWAEDLPLDPLALKHRQFRYIYDFSDDWTYDIELIDVLDDVPPVPALREGMGNAPFEACGGFAGYYELMDVLTTPDHPDNAAIHAWVDEMGYKFYDKDEVNEALHAFAKK